MKHLRIRTKIQFLAAILMLISPLSIVESANKKIKPLLVVFDANVPVLSYDGSRLSVGPEVGLGRVYDVGSTKMIGEYRVKISDSSALSSDGKMVRLFGPGVHTTFDVETGKKLSEGSTLIVENGKLVTGVGSANAAGIATRVISSDLETGAGIYRVWEKPLSDQPAVIVGRLSDQSLIAELKTDDEYLEGDIWRENAMTPDAKFVAASRFSESEILRRRTVIWEVATGRIVLNLPFSCHWLSLADDGTTLITRESGDDGEIRSWSISSGKEIATITMSSNGRKILASNGVISPDGKTLVTTRNADFFLWDTTTGKFITSVKQDHISKGNVKSAAFSGNGKILAIGSDTEVVTVWSVDEILGSTKQK